MKKTLYILMVWGAVLSAQDIILTSEQEKNWQINVEKPERSTRLPLGDFIGQVVTPPSLLHTISLPFEANVKQLNVATYQKVKKGDVLAKVTGTKWISIQQKAIAEAIGYKHHTYLTERKNMLCKEEIIPQKECVAANAKLEADAIKVAASKALLKSYGASSTMIQTLFTSFSLFSTIDVKSTINGRLVTVGALPGKSIRPSDALFVIQEKGNLWLESHIEAKRTKVLYEGQVVRIIFDGVTFDTTILQISPVVNPVNQTRLVRFLIPEKVHIVAGLRGNAHISIAAQSLRIKKTSVIKNKGKQVVFLKTTKGYSVISIKILAEDDTHYFIVPIKALDGKIAISSVAILKNMLGENNE